MGTGHRDSGTSGCIGDGGFSEDEQRGTGVIRAGIEDYTASSREVCNVLMARVLLEYHALQQFASVPWHGLPP